MFIARQRDSLPTFVTEADKADGLVHTCDQSALMFGSDRRNPTFQRPVVGIKNEGHRVVILPCTTKNHQDSPDFLELNKNRVMWSGEPRELTSYASYRYEVIDCSRLRKKIGIMPQIARLELLRWLKSRY